MNFARQRLQLSIRAGVMALVLLLACSASADAMSRCAPNETAPELWIMNGEVAHRIQIEDPNGFQRSVDTSDLFALERLGMTSLLGSTVADFKSYARFRRAVVAGRISPLIRWVMYDNEHWQMTPRDEQRQPARYEALFAKLAHRHGYKVILAPAQDLVFSMRKSGNRVVGAAWQRYLALHLAAISAKHANIYEIQAQADESAQFRAAGVYPEFVRAAAAQARAANPHVRVLAGLSTRRVSDAAQLDQDFSSTHSIVAGYWLNVPGADQTGPLAMAERFLDERQSAPGCSPSP